MAFAIKINGQTHGVDVDGDTPLRRLGGRLQTPEEGWL